MRGREFAVGASSFILEAVERRTTEGVEIDVWTNEGSLL